MARVEHEHHVLGEIDIEQARLDVRGRRAHQHRHVVERERQFAFAGEVEHADRLAVRVAQRQRAAREAAQPAEEMLAAVDRDRAAFDERGAERVRAAQRFAPARAGADVADAERGELARVAVDRQDRCARIGQQDHPVASAALGEEFEFGGGRGEQQAVRVVQLVEVAEFMQVQPRVVVPAHAVIEAAPPRLVDFDAQATLRQHAVGTEALANQAGCLQPVRKSLAGREVVLHVAPPQENVGPSDPARPHAKRPGESGISPGINPSGQKPKAQAGRGSAGDSRGRADRNRRA
ncbi:hypothetical protein BLA13014_05364 [Burkholderia aenigmatica]|uniref:Uncharacterized protein n=1 Tax=Burkholderia aenigmatica TaxID=2015348 RepID=A0A6P2Q323_9BURK|nr:hypothetical protein BLA13014_05364 [Burkholderia aenigmatica]